MNSNSIEANFQSRSDISEQSDLAKREQIVSQTKTKNERGKTTPAWQSHSLSVFCKPTYARSLSCLSEWTSQRLDPGHELANVNISTGRETRSRDNFKQESLDR